MLKSLDILIGLSVVMLVVSLIVTVITEALNNLLQTRGRNLRDGIAGLLQQIHGAMPPEACEKIANAILTHPLISSAGERFGTVIHREELTGLLLELVANGPSEIEKPGALTQDLHQHLSDLLKENGIKDPKQTMKDVRSLTLILEQNHPELSNYERYAMAFLQEAKSSFLAKMNGWFDQTMDRVSDRFTNSTRLVTFAGSLLVALVLQLDTAALVNRLNADPALRERLVEQAIQVNKSNIAPSGDKAQTLTLTATDQENIKKLQDLSKLDVVDIPTSFSDWYYRWNPANFGMKLLGILLTALLLSLGAPFWYNALKNLIKLRSIIAQKDDDQRTARQTSGGAGDGPSAAPTSATPLVVTGERGDLASVG